MLKKLLILALASVLAVGLASCRFNYPGDVATDNSTIEQPTQPSEPIAPAQPAHSAAYDAGYQNNLGISPATKSTFPSVEEYCQAMQEGMHSDLTGTDAADYVAGCVDAVNSGQ